MRCNAVFRDFRSYAHNQLSIALLQRTVLRQARSVIARKGRMGLSLMRKPSGKPAQASGVTDLNEEENGSPSRRLNEDHRAFGPEYHKRLVRDRDELVRWDLGTDPIQQVCELTGRSSEQGSLS